MIYGCRLRLGCVPWHCSCHPIELTNGPLLAALLAALFFCVLGNDGGAIKMGVAIGEPLGTRTLRSTEGRVRSCLQKQTDHLRVPFHARTHERSHAGTRLAGHLVDSGTAPQEEVDDGYLASTTGCHEQSETAHAPVPTSIRGVHVAAPRKRVVHCHCIAASRCLDQACG